MWTSGHPDVTLDCSQCDQVQLSQGGDGTANATFRVVTAADSAVRMLLQDSGAEVGVASISIAPGAPSVNNSVPVLSNAIAGEVAQLQLVATD